MRVLVRWLLRFATSLGLLLIVVSTTPVLRWWTSALSAEWGNQQGDVLIVLGGDMVGPEAMGMGSWWRSYYAVLEWREHHYRTIVVTGRAIAPLMRDFMVTEGIPNEVIRVENAASSTRESALFVSGMLMGESGRAVLLTSDFHMGRTLAAFNKAGIHASPIPIPDVRKRVSNPVQCWSVFFDLVLETTKVIYYKAHGWI